MASLRNDYHWIALNMLPGLGPARIKNLLESLGSPGAIFSSPVSELRKVPGIGKEFAARLADFNPDREAEKEISLAEEKNVKIITMEDEKYPLLLREIFDPPLALYIRGDIIPVDAESVAVVGTRHPSFYGKMVAEDLGRKLACRGITVVSGMARGIDTASHRGAVSGGGRTIAVLGCGVDVCYPPENSKLLENILANGAAVSEFPMGAAPDRGNFPRRNRIISGMSLGVVVVEAAQKSGSLITASMALEQGREVFAVPGKVDSPKSAGTNGLIKEGARLVNDVGDVLGEFAPRIGSASPAGEKQTGDPGLSPDEKIVLGALSSEPVHVDSLCGEISLPASRVLPVLMLLEVKGLVEQLPGKHFAKNTRK